MLSNEEILKNIEVIYVKDYHIKNIRAYVLDCYYSYEKVFTQIYSELLLNTINKRILGNQEKNMIDIRNVYTETLNILDKIAFQQQNKFKYIIKVSDIQELLLDLHYELNTELINNETDYRIIDNSVDAILIKINKNKQVL
ncbi:hypothetical protein [Paraclostridium sordellii]|uniref:hypothetical protein n=1 Tax=Paraclostridium sordellii TaxID=1505 RepID=UPI000E52AE10|nr:hypothetical protein [Paeniclostridium sordellii]RGW98169.1 hypothetical protein DWV40_16485 [Paeniclostridium sordellii]